MTSIRDIRSAVQKEGTAAMTQEYRKDSDLHAAANIVAALEE